MSELMDATISYLDANPPAQVQAVDRHPDKALSFYKNIGVHAESDHGALPIRTHDKREAHLPEEQRTFDVGYGHKLTETELKSGTIYGIPFERGLTSEDKTTILNKDMANNIKIARDGSWDKKLKEKGGSWDKIDQGFQLVLTSLAYNVGGTKAADEWIAFWTQLLMEMLNSSLNKPEGRTIKRTLRVWTTGFLKKCILQGLLKKPLK